MVSDNLKKCLRCGIDLVWHEGAFAGWVHSVNFAENQRLSAKCKEKGADGELDITPLTR